MQTSGSEPPNYMQSLHRHGTRVSRRQILKLSVLYLASSQFLFGAGKALAEQGAPDTPEEASFLRFSRAITGHADLNPHTSRRIHAAMRGASADFLQQSARLAELATEANGPEALLASATSAGLRDTALAIVAAWYTGSVGDDSDAVVVSYQEALMYRPVLDAQTVPTYCTYGPAWWVADPPAPGVSPPVEKPASESPTTGVPVETTDSSASTKTPSQNDQQSIGHAQ